MIVIIFFFKKKNMTNKISSIQEEIKILKILIRLDMINELKVLFSKNYIYKKKSIIIITLYK
ncbi:MAG: hypothetical protein DMG62_24855 [Acidobacteria bacterium]|nr:MAG: hypothetical protein DMG62_24855 [Acidobacteriota bacterium]